MIKERKQPIATRGKKVSSKDSRTGHLYTIKSYRTKTNLTILISIRFQFKLRPPQKNYKN